jgi:hypothetical protein
MASQLFTEEVVMSDLFISPFKPPNESDFAQYHIDPTSYAEAILARWKFARVVKPERATYLLTWELNEEGNRGILGGLQGDSKTVTFGTNYFQNSLDFILWHRVYVPENISLYLYDANLVLIFDLKPKLTKTELEKVIKGALGS